MDNTKETLLLSTNDVQTSTFELHFSELKLLFLNHQDGCSTLEHDDRLASFEDALYTASIIEAVRQSSMEKSWVKVLNEK